MNEELFARFRKCAVDVLSVDADKVTLEASFGDDLDEFQPGKPVGKLIFQLVPEDYSLDFTAE